MTDQHTLIERLRELGSTEPLADEAATVITNLLAALRLCRDALKDHEQYEDDDEPSLEGEAYRAAEDAIAKAVKA